MTRVLAREDAELGALLTAALGGDERAYADFLRRVAGLVRAFVLRRTRQGGIDAEDVVQDTLLAVHLKRHTWRTDAPVAPWLYAIARHKLIDAFRRQGKHAAIDIGDFVDDLPAPEEEERLSERDVSRALDSLAPGQRNVVSAISVDGKSISETAKVLGMNETAVRVALHRGLKTLAKRFNST